MRTEDLVTTLAADVSPVPRRAVTWRLLAGIFTGLAVSVGLMLAALGVRPDLDTAMLGFTFWLKWAYTASLAVVAIYATAKLARPEPRSYRALWFAGIPVLVLALVAAIELTQAPATHWLSMWLGRSWRECPWLVLLLCVPIFLGLMWSFRRLAPTQLRAAGAAAGLAAGACAATVYCLHCPEVSAIFVLTWYTLGMALAASLGALVGPRLLRG